MRCTTHVKLLSGKGTTTDTRSVSLGHADNVADGRGRNAETRAHSTDARRATRDKGVRAKVEVQHECIGALDEHALAIRQRLVDERDAIDDVGA